nr:AAA family ATPase [Conexibacter arvalis]
MDLTALGRPDAVAALLAAYRGAGGDPGDAGLLAFHAVYRAHVRAKVSLLRAAQERDDGEEEAAAAERERSAALLAVAERYAWRLRLPPALVVCGPSASGKSVLAAEIGRRAGVEPISSDRVRKRLAGVAPTERAGQAVYDEAMNARTYEALGRAAAEAVAAGEPAIVDATFRRRPDRDAFARGWEESRAAGAGTRAAVGASTAGAGTPAAAGASTAGAGAPAAEAVAYVELTASPELLRARARRRLDDPERVSDGTPELALAQLAAFEPLSEIAPARHHLLRADRPPAQLADALAAALDGLLAAPPSA